MWGLASASFALLARLFLRIFTVTICTDGNSESFSSSRDQLLASHSHLQCNTFYYAHITNNIPTIGIAATTTTTGTATDSAAAPLLLLLLLLLHLLLLPLRIRLLLAHLLNIVKPTQTYPAHQIRPQSHPNPSESLENMLNAPESTYPKHLPLVSREWRNGVQL